MDPIIAADARRGGKPHVPSGVLPNLKNKIVGQPLSRGVIPKLKNLPEERQAWNETPNA
jgi:hypothetical protein